MPLNEHLLKFATARIKQAITPPLNTPMPSIAGPPVAPKPPTGQPATPPKGGMNYGVQKPAPSMQQPQTTQQPVYGSQEYHAQDEATKNTQYQQLAAARKARVDAVTPKYWQEMEAHKAQHGQYPAAGEPSKIYSRLEQEHDQLHPQPDASRSPVAAPQPSGGPAGEAKPGGGMPAPAPAPADDWAGQAKPMPSKVQPGAMPGSGGMTSGGTDTPNQQSRTMLYPGAMDLLNQHGFSDMRQQPGRNGQATPLGEFNNVPMSAKQSADKGVTNFPMPRSGEHLSQSQPKGSLKSYEATPNPNEQPLYPKHMLDKRPVDRHKLGGINPHLMEWAWSKVKQADVPPTPMSQPSSGIPPAAPPPPTNGMPVPPTPPVVQGGVQMPTASQTVQQPAVPTQG